jgi:hypothetical protein
MSRRGRPSAGLAGGPALRGGRRIAEQKIGPGARARVMDAHRLGRDGQHREAAAAFADVARITRERHLSRMATHLGAQAARYSAKAGDKDGFVQHAEQAIADARTEGDAAFSARTFGTLVASLADTPFAAGASSFAEAVHQAVGVAPAVAIVDAPTAEASRSWRRHLPSECLACGGTVGSSEVVFNRDGTADCVYCGSLLTA